MTFCATHAEKLSCIDKYEDGCETKTNCVLSERIDIVSDTLPGLLSSIGDHYGITIDDVFIGADEDEDINSIGYNRLEDNDGNEPSPGQLQSWKMGKTILYLCDYTFAIEKRQTQALTASDFIGIKTH